MYIVVRFYIVFELNHHFYEFTLRNDFYFILASHSLGNELVRIYGAVLTTSIFSINMKYDPNETNGFSLNQQYF